jgi:hypothetical protein
VSVVLAGCQRLPSGDGDDAPVLDALLDLGVAARWAPWDEITDAKLVVLRATWDYTERLAEFLTWCDTVPALANPSHVVRWNSDKRYLVELAASGVPVVPTQVVAPGETPDWPTGEVVVKPSIGAGSRGAARCADPASAALHLATLHAAGHTALVQPYQAGVDAAGETALVFLGGQYSHAFGKAAILRTKQADESGLFATEALSPTQPDTALLRTGELVMDAAADRLGIDRADLLYARVDLLPGQDGQPLLLELELAEPSLGFRQNDPAAAIRFARLIAARI